MNRVDVSIGARYSTRHKYGLQWSLTRSLSNDSIGLSRSWIAVLADFMAVEVTIKQQLIICLIDMNC